MALSRRLADVVDALPVRPGMRVLEIGCGTGAAARALSARIGSGRVLGVDRSAKAIDAALRASADAIAGGALEFRQCAIEDFALAEGEAPYDIAFAIRVGALDGRHPELEARALARVRAALKPGGALYLDGGTPLCRVQL
jgi:SAM-dependent methyltransferase